MNAFRLIGIDCVEEYAISIGRAAYEDYFFGAHLLGGLAFSGVLFGLDEEADGLLALEADLL